MHPENRPLQFDNDFKPINVSEYFQNEEHTLRSFSSSEDVQNYDPWSIFDLGGLAFKSL